MAVARRSPGIESSSGEQAVKVQFLRQAAQLMEAAVLEAGARAGDQIAHRARHDRFVRVSEVRDTIAGMYITSASSPVGRWVLAHSPN